MSFTTIDLKNASDYIYSETGIVLDSTKSYLITNRLMPIMEEIRKESLNDLIYEAQINKHVKQKIIDAVSTNETYFFRDKNPFELIKMNLAPAIFDKSSSLSIWSAASSTGQEAYSIAMDLKEILFDFSSYSVKIVGTDISSDAVARANHGVYNKFELSRGLTDKHITRYFEPYKGTDFKIDDELRSIVKFAQANLLSMPLFRSMYDIVLCRNVAIYFSREDKRKLFERIHQTLRIGGALIIGSTESIIEMNDLFERETFHGIVYYRKK